MYAKDPCKEKYQSLINKGESTVIKCLNDFKAFIKYSNGMDDTYKNIEEYNPSKNEEHSLYLMIQLLICLLIKKNLTQK